MSTQHPQNQPPAPNAYPNPQGLQQPAGYYPGPGHFQPKAPASGLRIGAGVVALIAGVLGVLFALVFLFDGHRGGSTPFNGFMNLFLIVGSVGSFVTGIVVMAKQRKRGGYTPRLLAGFAASSVIACLGFTAAGNTGIPGAWMIILPFALGTLILAVLVIVLEKRKA